MGTLHKERKSATQHDRDQTGNFTQVRAAARGQILILLWWIEGGKVVVVRSTLDQQGLPRGSSDYVRTRVRVV